MVHRLVSQTALNLRLQALVGAGQLGEAVSLLNWEVCMGDLGLPREAYPLLVAAVGESGDVESREAMQVVLPIGLLY